MKRLNPEEQIGILQGMFAKPEVDGLDCFIRKYARSIERERWLATLKKAGLDVDQYPFNDEREVWFAGFDNKLCPDEANEFCAVIEPYYTYVVWSKWGIKGERISSMYPSRVNSRMNGGWTGYSFPPDLLTEGDIKSRIFRLTGDECKDIQRNEETYRQTQERAKELGKEILVSQISMLESLFND